MRLIEKWVDDNEGGQFRKSVTIVITQGDFEFLCDTGRVERLPKDERFDPKVSVVIEGSS